MTGTPAPEHESRHDRLPSPAGPPAQECREQVPAPDRPPASQSRDHVPPSDEPPPDTLSQGAYRGVSWSTTGSWPAPPSAPGHRSPPSEGPSVLPEGTPPLRTVPEIRPASRPSAPENRATRTAPENRPTPRAASGDPPAGQVASEERPTPRTAPKEQGDGQVASGGQPVARDAPGGPQDVPERRPEAPQPRPAADAQWMLGHRRTFPDEQVWPPLPRPAGEPPGASTQPFPAVPAAPASGPPRAPGPVSDAGVSDPAPALGAGPGTVRGPAGPGTVPGRGGSDGSGVGSGSGDPAARGEGATVPGAAAQPPRRRTALRVGGAVLAVALAVGIPTWQGYSLYRGGVPDYRIHTVAAGGTGTLMNVSWRVRVEQADNLPGKPPIRPDQRWLKITVTRTSLNAEGVIRRGEPDIEVQHPDGRTWRAEIDEDGLPLEGENHRIGIGYDYEATSLVPRTVAGQVEVRIRPSTFRIPLREEPAADLFDRVGTEKIEPGDQVLLFRR